MKKRDEKGPTTSKPRKVIPRKGYVLHLSADRDGDVLTAEFELLRAREETPLLRVTGSGDLRNINLNLGLETSEEAFWELILKILDILGARKI